MKTIGIVMVPSRVSRYKKVLTEKGFTFGLTEDFVKGQTLISVEIENEVEKKKVVQACVEIKIWFNNRN